MSYNKAEAPQLSKRTDNPSDGDLFRLYEEKPTLESDWRGSVLYRQFEEITDEYAELAYQQAKLETEKHVQNVDQEDDMALILITLGLSADSEAKRFSEGSFLYDARELPATRRLDGLAQQSPVVNQLLGLNFTRGQHTEDCMRLAAQVFTQMAVNTPDLFDELGAEYLDMINLQNEDLTEMTDRQLAKRVKLIQHLTEVMRLHDLFTTSFQGSMHGRLIYKGKPYNENEILLEALSDNPTYQELAALYLKDEETSAFYTNHRLQRDVILRISEDAINGSLTLAQLLKGKQPNGRRTVSLDNIAYVARGAQELSRLPEIDNKAPILERIQAAYGTVIEVFEALAEGKPIDITPCETATVQFEELIPPDIVGLERNNGADVIYDGFSVYSLYLVHILSRLFVSGSPLVRAMDHTVYEYYTERFAATPEKLTVYLFRNSEQELLAGDLSELWPIAELDPTSLVRSESLPKQIKGWSYSTEPKKDYIPVRFRFHDFSDTEVRIGENILPVKDMFPTLNGFAENLSMKPDLFLVQGNF